MADDARWISIVIVRLRGPVGDPLLAVIVTSSPTTRMPVPRKPESLAIL
jgi:hypothetical protein